MTLSFENRVVVVTGAGQGLGRCHALAFAKRGAKVVVNDLGGGAHGGGSDSSVAQGVVNEIKAGGGEAVLNGDSVEQGDRIVQCAMDTYGRIDVLINNAGILRDVSFAKMTDEDWDLIYRVHTLGAYKTSHAAWKHMRNDGYGRILMTSSGAGIYGNFGQANYSTAKLGLFGLTQTLAVEGRSKNILVNAIAPTAASRLTATVLPPALLEVLKPEAVTPLALVLCHEASDTTGAMFEVGGGYICQVRWEQTRGVFFDGAFDEDQVLNQWSTITSFENARHAANVADSLATLSEKIGVQLALAPQ